MTSKDRSTRRITWSPSWNPDRHSTVPPTALTRFRLIGVTAIAIALTAPSATAWQAPATAGTAVLNAPIESEIPARTPHSTHLRHVGDGKVEAASSPCLADTDGDGLVDCREDADIDGDGNPATTPGPDTDGDGGANYLDSDDDGDGIPTADENADPNGDGDPRDALDSDRDGQSDYLDAPTSPTTGTVAAEQKISDTEGGFDGVLGPSDWLGGSSASIGDLDGDGVVDLVVGAHGDDDGGDRKGAVYVLFLEPDGTVKTEQKISDTEGGLGGVLDAFDQFGQSVSGIGDIDGDGVVDIAVGSTGDDDGGDRRGAVYILLLNSDGTVRAKQKISQIEGGLSGVLDDLDRFGSSVTGVGDIDGDGIPDIAVGAPHGQDGGPDRGAVHILFLNPDGTVKTEQKISSIEGGLGAALDDTDYFGASVAGLGDVDGDGTPDLAVGADGDDDGGPDRGAVHILFLSPDGTVKTEQKISSIEGGLIATLDDSDVFGRSAASIGDLDHDDVPDIAIGARGDGDGGYARGAVHILFLNPDGTVKTEQKISDTEGNLTAALDNNDAFGQSVSGVGDLDGDGSIGLVVGAALDDDGGTGASANRGAVYVLDLAIDHCAVDSDSDGLWDCQEDADSDNDGDPATTPGPDTDGDGSANHLDSDDDGDGNPSAAENADPNGDGDPRDAIDSDRDGQPDYLDSPTSASSGRVSDEQKISDTQGGLTASLDDGDLFGRSAVSIGDLDSDGVNDLAVGAVGDDEGGSDRGAVYVLFMNPDATVKGEQVISDGMGGFSTALDDGDEFGLAVAGLGDLDGDGVPDLAVGARRDGGGSDRGAVYVLFMNPDGTVRAEQKISGTQGELTALLNDSDWFGGSVTGLGDVDGDGVPDMAVGAHGDDDGGTDRGAVHILFLDPDGTVKAEQKISDTQGGLTATLDDHDFFGAGAAGLGDLDGDGVPDMAVGAHGDDDGGTDRGAVHILFLDPDGTVKAEQKISDTQGGLTVDLADGDMIGRFLSGVGDLDGDHTIGLAVAAYLDDDGGPDRGAVYLLDLTALSPPMAVADTATVPENGSIVIAVLDNDSDADGDAIWLVSITQPASGAAADNGDGTVTYTPNTNWRGTDTFTYTVTDGAFSATATVTVTVTATRPTANDHEVTTPEDTPVTVEVLINELDTEVLSVASITQPLNGTAIHDEATITYSPDPDWHGTDVLEYSITDGVANDTAAVRISVSPVNDPPTATDDRATTPEDTAVDIDVLANDADRDGDTLALVSTVRPVHGTAAISDDGTISYSPEQGFHGVDTFTYTITDGALTANASITVLITPADDPPAPTTDDQGRSEDIPSGIEEPDSEPITSIPSSQDSNGPGSADAETEAAGGGTPDRFDHHDDPSSIPLWVPVGVGLAAVLVTGGLRRPCRCFIWIARRADEKDEEEQAVGRDGSNTG